MIKKIIPSLVCLLTGAVAVLADSTVPRRVVILSQEGGFVQQNLTPVTTIDWRITLLLIFLLFWYYKKRK